MFKTCCICHKKYEVDFIMGTDNPFYCDECIKNRPDDVAEARRKNAEYWGYPGEVGETGMRGGDYICNK